MVDVDDYGEIDGFGEPVVFQETATSAAGTYARYEQLGFGAFGRVYRVARVSDGSVMALKELDNKQDGIEQAAVTEYEISRILDGRDPGFCRREAICITEMFIDNRAGKIYLLLPLGDPLTLQRFMYNHLHPPLLRLSESARQRVQPVFARRALEIAAELLRMVALLHSHDIRHRDIKEDNLLFSNVLRQKPRMRLIDFGFACVAEAADDAPLSRVCIRGQGKVSPYTDRELARVRSNEIGEGRRAELQDVFACGATIYSMAMPRSISRIPPTFAVLEDKLRYLPVPFLRLLKSMLGSWRTRKSAAQYQLRVQNMLELM